MKRVITIIVLAIMIISGTLFGGCVRVDISGESGDVVTREFDFTGFTRIEVGHAFKADIASSDNYSVSVVINEKMADRLKVTKVGDTLEIGLKEPAWNYWGVRNRPQVTITMPELRGLDLSGASEANIRGFKSSRDFTLDVSGASNLDVDMETLGFYGVISGASHVNGYLKAGLCDVEISGASHVTFTGSGGDLRLNVSGASHTYLENYAAVNADIELSGASQSRLKVSGRLDVEVSGASHLEYSGSPTLGRVDISGASSIKPR
jgi:hypothetical protein